MQVDWRVGVWYVGMAGGCRVLCGAIVIAASYVMGFEAYIMTRAMVMSFVSRGSFQNGGL